VTVMCFAAAATGVPVLLPGGSNVCSQNAKRLSLKSSLRRVSRKNSEISCFGIRVNNKSMASRCSAMTLSRKSTAKFCSSRWQSESRHRWSESTKASAKGKEEPLLLDEPGRPLYNETSPDAFATSFVFSKIRPAARSAMSISVHHRPGELAVFCAVVREPGQGSLSLNLLVFKLVQTLLKRKALLRIFVELVEQGVELVFSGRFVITRGAPLVLGTPRLLRLTKQKLAVPIGLRSGRFFRLRRFRDLRRGGRAFAVRRVFAKPGGSVFHGPNRLLQPRVFPLKRINQTPVLPEVRLHGLQILHDVRFDFLSVKKKVSVGRDVYYVNSQR
jgi:hypothetical protein